MIIGNAYASDEELEALGQLNRYQLALAIEFTKEASTVEKKITLTEQHFRRGDITDQVVRSTEVRKKYKNEANPAHDNTQAFQIGDVVIGNDAFGKYKNELQIVLQPHTDDRKNKVGKITEDELLLLDFVKPWTKFRFIEK